VLGPLTRKVASLKQLVERPSVFKDVLHVFRGSISESTLAEAAIEAPEHAVRRLALMTPPSKRLAQLASAVRAVG
jgi:hypothetical protein